MAIKAHDSTLQIDVATPGTPDVAIGEVKSFSGFDGEAGEIDVTHLTSAAKEFQLGLIDNGSFSVEWFPNYSDAGQNAVRSAQTSGDEKWFLLTLPNGTEALFKGLVKSASSISGGIDGAVEGSVTIKITGGLQITP